MQGAAGTAGSAGRGTNSTGGPASGGLLANASHSFADDTTPTKTNTPSSASRPEPSTRGSEALAGGFGASRSGVDAGAANEGGASHGNSSAGHSADASASVSR
jgi:hypothetical protein